MQDWRRGMEYGGGDQDWDCEDGKKGEAAEDGGTVGHQQQLKNGMSRGNTFTSSENLRLRVYF